MSEQRVVIAEDQPSLRMLFAATLQRAGILVSNVDNGRDAVLVARRDHPDLMLLDIGLPGLDGLDACRRLKADPTTADIKLVLVTARCQPHEREAGVAAGADDYLVKPFSPAELVARVQRWLRMAAAAQAAASAGPHDPKAGVSA